MLKNMINLSYQLWLRMTPGILPILLHPPSTEADRVKAIEEWGIPERTLPSFMHHGIVKLPDEDCRGCHVTEEDRMKTVGPT